MADREVVLNHVLTFIFSKVHKDDENRIKKTVENFFKPDTISEARDMLLEHASLLKTELPKLPNRRGGAPDGRTQRELKDIFEIIDALDSLNFLERLPKYASDNPLEMPSPNITEGDLRAIMDRLDMLDNKFGAMTALLHTAISNSSVQPTQPIVNKPIVTSREASSFTKTRVGLSAINSPAAAAIVPGLSRPAANSALTTADHRNTDSATHTNNEDITDSEPFHEVESKKSKKRRRIRSKDNNVNETVHTTDFDTDDERAIVKSNYAVAAAQPPKPTRPIIGERVLVGKKHCDDGISMISAAAGGLKRIVVGAAKPYVNKAVFCVDNVATNVDHKSLALFIESLGVRVITCCRVQPRRPQWQRRRNIHPDDRNTFRLCIPRTDCDKLLNADAWPEHILISRWIFSKNPRPNPEVNGDDHEPSRMRSPSPSHQRQHDGRRSSVGGTTDSVSAASAMNASAPVFVAASSYSTDFPALHRADDIIVNAQDESTSINMRDGEHND
jgi:hypothetical protein